MGNHRSLTALIKHPTGKLLLFGTVLALLTLLLKYVEYRYFVGNLRVEIYTLFIALLFTLVGLFIGKKLLGQPKTKDLFEEKEAIRQERVLQLKLSEREYEILRLIRDGLTNQEIADKLYIALPTVKTHVSKLYAKLEVKNRTSAVFRAKELKVL